MKWSFGILFFAGHVLAAATTTATTAAAELSTDQCNQCQAYDQKRNVYALISGPYEASFAVLHSAIIAKDFSNLPALTKDWNDSVTQILDLIEKDGCLHYTLFSTLRTMVFSIFTMISAGDQMEDYNLPEVARPIITACGDNAEKFIQVMRAAHLAHPTCYPCKRIDNTAQYVTAFNCYAKRLGMPTIAPLDFCKAEQEDLCPLLVSMNSEAASATIVPSSAAVSSAAAVSSPAVVSSQTAASSQADLSSQAANSQPADIFSQAIVSSQIAVSSQAADFSKATVSPKATGLSKIAVSSQAIVYSQVAVSSQAVAFSGAAESSQTVASSKAMPSNATGSSRVAGSSQAAASSQAAVPSHNASSSRTAVSSEAAASSQADISSNTQSSFFSAGSNISASGSSSLGAVKSTRSKQALNTDDGNVVTTVVTEFTTYCPEPTTFCVGDGKCYTATRATTITVTDCPCTLITTCVPEKQPAAVQSNHATATMPLLTVAPAATASVVSPESQVPPVAPVASVNQIPLAAPANAGSAALPQSIAVIFGAILLASM